MTTKYAEQQNAAITYAYSNLCPKNLQKQPNDIFMLFDIGESVGLSRAQSIHNIYIVNGAPTFKGSAYRAILLRSPLVESIVNRTNDFESTCIIKRKNHPEFSYTFSLDDAERAGLYKPNSPTNSPWYTFTKRMLEWKAFAFCAMDACADIIQGFKILEEVLDVPTGNHEKLNNLINQNEKRIYDWEQCPEIQKFNFLCEQFSINLETVQLLIMKTGYKTLADIPLDKLKKLNAYILKKNDN